jgi:PleD family two-component response regulator
MTATAANPAAPPAPPAGSPAAAPTPLGRKARILLVDDHPVVRQGLALMLAAEQDIEVCGQAKDVPDALATVAGLPRTS